MATNDMQWPRPGIGSVGSYQMSGTPYAESNIVVPDNTGNAVQVQFEYVTKFVTIRNTSNPGVAFRVGFSQSGVAADNYFILDGGQSYNGEWRLQDLYLISDSGAASEACIIAGLTPIPRSN